MIHRETKGKGVDFVLNSLSEGKLLASVRCLGQGGHFLEIGKFDMANDTKLGLGVFLKELTFHAVLADTLLTATDEDIAVTHSPSTLHLVSHFTIPNSFTVLEASNRHGHCQWHHSAPACHRLPSS